MLTKVLGFFLIFPFLVKMNSSQNTAAFPPMPISLFAVSVDLFWVFLDHKKIERERNLKYSAGRELKQRRLTSPTSLRNF